MKFIQAWDFGDSLVVVGLIGLFYGLWNFQTWLAFAVVGALVFFIGLRVSKKKEAG